MRKYFFYDDYSEGAHPKILEALGRANLQPERTYGTDTFSAQAEQLIQQQIGNVKAKVYLEKLHRTPFSN